jgi:hypothetical protein
LAAAAATDRRAVGARLSARPAATLANSGRVYPRGICSRNLCQRYRTKRAPRMETITPPG